MKKRIQNFNLCICLVEGGVFQIRPLFIHIYIDVGYKRLPDSSDGICLFSP